MISFSYIYSDTWRVPQIYLSVGQFWVSEDLCPWLFIAQCLLSEVCSVTEIDCVWFTMRTLLQWERSSVPLIFLCFVCGKCDIKWGFFLVPLSYWMTVNYQWIFSLTFLPRLYLQFSCWAYL
jgi:hypothetical protein